MKIDYNNSTINALQLFPPQITFGSGRTLVPHKGNFDMRAPINDNVEFKDWCIIYHKSETGLVN